MRIYRGKEENGKEQLERIIRVLLINYEYLCSEFKIYYSN